MCGLCSLAVCIYRSGIYTQSHRVCNARSLIIIHDVYEYIYSIGIGIHTARHSSRPAADIMYGQRVALTIYIQYIYVQVYAENIIGYASFTPKRILRGGSNWITGASGA